MIKKHLIFDLDWTLIESMSDTIKIALNYLKKIANTDIQKAEYILNTSWGMSLREQLVIIYDWVDNINIDEIKNWIYNILFKNEAAFFVWIPEKIIELSKNYKLFLTTWNSTPTAIKYLTNWWIIDCFELIYWSDKILKWMEHLNIFKEYSNDSMFFEKSVYIWDWTPDRMFAKQAWIDFIHIWNDKIDKYEIESVIEIDSILEKLNK